MPDKMNPEAASSVVKNAAGLPFLQNTVLGDLFYSTALFGAFELSLRRFPQLRLQPAGQ
jgi:hypothetical protein